MEGRYEALVLLSLFFPPRKWSEQTLAASAYLGLVMVRGTTELMASIHASFLASSAGSLW